MAAFTDFAQQMSASQPAAPAAPTPEAISSFVSQNIGNPQAIYDAAQQFNVSAQDIFGATGYTPEQQASYFGSAGLPALGGGAAASPSVGGLPALDQNTGTPSSNYQNLVTQAYGSFGRTGFGSDVSQIDQPGFDYWVNQLQSGAIAPDNFMNAFNAAGTAYAQQNPNDPYTQYVSDFLVNKAYQDVLGRAPEEAGADYWQQQLISGQLPIGSLSEQVARGAQGLDRVAAQDYLGEEVWAPKEYLQGTQGAGYQDIVDYVAQNIDNPMQIYQQAEKLGIDPDEILQAYTSLGESPYTKQQIQDYLGTGQQAYNTEFEKTLTEVFGGQEETAQMKDMLYNNFVQQIQNAPNISAQRKQELLASETPDSIFSKIYNPQEYASKTFDEIATQIQQSDINKYQEAVRLANIAKNVAGYTNEEADLLVGKAMFGEGLNEFEQQVYDSLLRSNEVEPQLMDQILAYAAQANPEAQIFKDNPELLGLYTPLPGVVTKTSDTKWGGGSGQYGYYNGAPILNAEVAKSIVGEHGTTRNLNAGGVNYSDIAKTLGMDFAAHAETTGWKAGRSIVGVDFDKQYLQDLAAFEDAERRGEIRVQSDPESGTRYVKEVPNPYKSNPYDDQPNFIYQEVFKPSLPNTTMFGALRAPNTMAEVNKQLSDAAETLGISTEGKDTETLFDEITDRTTGLYQVIGNSGAIDSQVYPDAKNHINALYREVSDKLVPVKVDFFHADAPKSKKFLGVVGGTVGEIMNGVTNVPFFAEMATIASGGNPAVYAALKGAQAANNSGKIIDGVKAATIAYYAPKVTTSISGSIMQSLPAGLPTNIAQGISDAVSRAAVSAGAAALTGQDAGKAAMSSLLASAAQAGASNLPFMDQIPKDYQGAVARIIAEVALGQEVQTAVQRTFLSEGTKILKDVAKNAAKNQPVKEAA